MCSLVHILVDPMYQVKAGLCSTIKTKTHPRPDNDHFPAPAQSSADLNSLVVPILLALGPDASQDPVLLYKMLRICKSGLG